LIRKRKQIEDIPAYGREELYDSQGNQPIPSNFERSMIAASQTIP